MSGLLSAGPIDVELLRHYIMLFIVITVLLAKLAATANGQYCSQQHCVDYCCTQAGCDGPLILRLQLAEKKLTLNGQDISIVQTAM